MTDPAAAGRAASRFDDLWQPQHWRDELGGKPRGGFFAVILALAVGWNLIANLWLPSGAWVVANLALATVLVAAARAVGMSYEEIGLRADRIGRGLRVGGVAMGVVAVALAISVAVPSLRGSFDNPDIARHSGLTDAYYVLVRIPLGTVVLEELLFRGVLLGLAMRRLPVLVAVMVTAACFGIWHIVPAVETAGGGLLAVSGATVGTVAVTTVAGVALAWLRLRANSIVAPVLAHIATNSFAYVAAVVVLKLL